MSSENYPLRDISDSQFQEFREKYLNKKRLSLEDLEMIQDAFGLIGKKNARRFRVSCDEAHAHSYECVEFKDREGAIVERLVNELKRYQHREKEISEIILDEQQS